MVPIEQARIKPVIIGREVEGCMRGILLFFSSYLIYPVWGPLKVGKDIGVSVGVDVDGDIITKGIIIRGIIIRGIWISWWTKSLSLIKTCREVAVPS